MTLNAKIGGLVDFFGDFGLQHKSVSFTRWRHGTIVMRSGQRIWYLYINSAWTLKFLAKLLNQNCYRLLRVLWALAQISCFFSDIDILRFLWIGIKAFLFDFDHAECSSVCLSVRSLVCLSSIYLSVRLCICLQWLRLSWLLAWSYRKW